MVSPDRLFVLGASAGGRAAVIQCLGGIPADIDAAFAVVVHSAFHMPSFFAPVLAKKTDLKVVEAENGLKIESGTVYVAKPNHHLFIEEDSVRLSHGPRENLFRPAVDVLFRSAAVSYGNRCIGILLSGRLNDGTTGLEAIKKCGGLAIIQNPETAEYGDMPQSAQDVVDIDFTAELEELPNLISRIMQDSLPSPLGIPPSLIRENGIATKIKSQVATEEVLGKQVPYACASCGGPLWEMEGSELTRYRCHVGHAFSQEALLEGQNGAMEEALWIALRNLEEKYRMLNSIAAKYEESRSKMLAKSYRDKAVEVLQQIDKLRAVLQLAD